MRPERSAEEVAPRKKRERRNLVRQRRGLVFLALLEMLLPKTFTKYEWGQSQVGMSITVLRVPRSPRKSIRQSVHALVSLPNADLPPLLLIRAPLRARGIRHPCLLLPVRPRCLLLLVQAGILLALEKEGVTVRVVTFPVFTLVAMARCTKIALDHLPLVPKLWKRIVFHPCLHCRRTYQIIALRRLRMVLPFPLPQPMIVRLIARSPSRFPRPRSPRPTITTL